MPVSDTATMNTEPAATLRTSVRANLSPRAGMAMRALGWLAALALAYWFMSAWWGGASVRNDFTQNVWLPARLVLDGVSPYNPTAAQVDAALGAHASAFDDGFNGGEHYYFVYPIWVAIVFTPFAMLPLTVAVTLWRALNLLLLVWGVVHLLRASNPSFRSNRAAVMAAITLTVFLSLIYRESIVTLFIGQFSIIEFGILVAIWGFFAGLGRRTTDDGRPSEAVKLQSEIRVPSGRPQSAIGVALVGLGLAVLATKPQAVGLPVLLLVLWAISRRRWAIPAWAAGSLAFLILVPLVAYPSSLGDWLRIVVGGQAGSQIYVSASVWGVSYQWLGDNLPWMAVAGVLSLVGVAVLMPYWRRDLMDRVSPVPMSLALAIVVNSLISPYMLGYEHVLLLFPAVLMLAAAGFPDEQPGRGWKLWRMAIYGWMGALPFVIVAVQTAVGSKEYPVVAQSLTMLALLYVARLRWRMIRET